MKRRAALSLSEGRAVPVELRFIDLFMATVGALAFIGMLFAWLITKLPQEAQTTREQPRGPAPLLQPIELVTRTFPDARQGAPYEVALAYRGGTPPVRWQVVAGEKELERLGLSFDAVQGRVHGDPTRAGTARFIVRVVDSLQQSDESSYELNVAPPPADPEKIEKLVAWFLLAGLGLWLVMTVRALVGIVMIIHTLKRKHKKGHTKVTIQSPDGSVHVLPLPSSIKTYEKQMWTEIRKAAVIIMIMLAATSWIYAGPLLPFAW